MLTILVVSKNFWGSRLFSVVFPVLYVLIVAFKVFDPEMTIVPLARITVFWEDEDPLDDEVEVLFLLGVMTVEVVVLGVVVDVFDVTM